MDFKKVFFFSDFIFRNLGRNICQVLVLAKINQKSENLGKLLQPKLLHLRQLF